MIRRAAGSLSLILVVGVGCSDNRQADVAAIRAAELAAKPRSALEVAEPVHHVGSVVGMAGRRIEHRFAVVNRSQGPVAIAEVVNRKPCCGEVAVDRTSLAPGETAEVTVTLMVGGRFDELVHQAEVVTDPPQPESLTLRTIVKVYPPPPHRKAPFG